VTVSPTSSLQGGLVRVTDTGDDWKAPGRKHWRKRWDSCA